MNSDEWEKENSLTCVEDRTSTRENPWRPDLNLPELSEEETKEGMKCLNNVDFIKKFPRYDRTYADPNILNQTIGLISFTPAKGAKPNENGVYGFAKLRGNYETETEANQRAEYLIRNVDSYHQIYHTYVGRPFPITSSSKYSAEVSEIDIKKEIKDTVSHDVKMKRIEEKKTINEIKEREQKLISDSELAKNDKLIEDPFDVYITLKVKKAQLTWTYNEHQKKIDEIKKILVKTRRDIDKLDLENTCFKDEYFEKYTDARKSAGLKEDYKESFIKYMVEDIEIPEVDELYEKMLIEESNENKTK
jgi:hypothetical protein